MESSWKRPESKMNRPKIADPLTTEERADAQDAQEYAESVAKAQRAKENEDKIGKIFSGAWYITDWTNPILLHPSLQRQMTVSRFYPESFVAIDIFQYVGESEKQLIELKRKTFKENEVDYGGQKRTVRYGALSYADSLASLAPQLEA